MGCSTSRIDHLPAVSLCHDRCKFVEEALYQSYALADAHFAYMHSLKTLGPTLGRFFDQNLDDNSNTNIHSDPVKPNPLTSTKSSSSPDHCASSSNSDSHLDFPSDDSEDEEFKEKDFDLLHRIHPNYFDRQTPTPSRTSSYSYRDHNKYDYYVNNGVTSPDGGSAWVTPSPPPPPSGSSWEFLNFFEAYERYELPIKDKDGIPEAKEEFESNERLEKDKFVGDSVNLVKEEKKSKADDVKQHKVDVVETKAVSEEKEKKEKKDSMESKIQSPLMVVRELEALFDRAAESGNEVIKIFDTGKFRCYHNNSIYQGVSSKMLHAVTPSFMVIPSKNADYLSSTEKIGSVHVGFEEDLGVQVAVNLSSILNKLCIWEKKLYNEVKAEEKLRIMLARSYRQMKNMGEKVAGSSKVDSDRALITALSTKIKVAFHVIDRTSVTINKLRDEELWPLISELIQKLLGMWKAMLDCHRCQSQTVAEAKSLDAIISNGKFSETHLEAAIQLKVELQNWNMSFSDWINAQKSYVKALNGWILKCLPKEPEEMPDETPTSSPRSKSGEPPLFAFCIQWSHATARISEMEVLNAMHEFFMKVNQLVERHSVYLQQRLSTDKELEKRVKILERNEKRMQKALQARGKKMFLPSKDKSRTQFSGGTVHQSEVTFNSSLHLGLKQIFMAIEKFSANNVQVYEELQLHIDKAA